MRLFVAVPLPADVASAAAAALPKLPGLRGVRPEHMHLTLAFLGEVSGDALAEAIAATQASAGGHRRFPASLDHLGRFPESGPPRVVWLGLGQGAAELTALASSVRSALSARRLPFDAKAFQPHLTLARVRDGATREDARAIAEAIAGARVAPLGFEVSGVLLLQSDLTPQGPRYTPRAAVPLGVGEA